MFPPTRFILRPISSIIENIPPQALVHVKETTRFRPKGFKFAESFKSGTWDGWTKLARKYPRGIYLPTGLVPHVAQRLEIAGFPIEFINERFKPIPQFPPLKDDLNGVILRDYQEGMLASILLQKFCFDGALSFIDDPDYFYSGIGEKTKYRIPGWGIWNAATGSGKTETAAMLIARLAVPTLFLVYGNSLILQTAKRFRTRLHYWLIAHDLRIGTALGGKLDNQFITVGSNKTVASLIKQEDAKTLDWLNSIQLLILDEAHTGAATQFQTVFRQCPAYYRIGMSGTPLARGDGQNLKIIGSFGDTVFKTTNAEMVEKNVIPKAKIIILPVKGRLNLPWDAKWHEIYDAGIVYNHSRNKMIIRIIQDAYAQGKKVMVVFRRIEHGNLLSDMLWCQENIHHEHTFIPHEVLHGQIIEHEKVDGDTSNDNREMAIAKLQSGIVNVIIASNIFGVGIDIPEVDVLINAAGSKEIIPVKQRLGRGLRGKDLVMYDFADMQHRKLATHAANRIKIYRNENCFEVTVGDEI